MNRCLTDIINNEARDYAIYTVEDRAIPNMIDGLKPVQRYIMQSALNAGKADGYKKFHKLADIGSRVAGLGYHHAETAAQEAGALMACTWNNNIQILDGQGAFGSRFVQKSGQARYVFTKVHENFFKIYQDIDCAPKHEDPEHIPPAFFLPVVPMVLANGVSGTAVGYSTDILPHSFESLVECTRLALNGKLNKEPTVKFPAFNGVITERDDNKPGVYLYGTFELTGKTKLTITEIPIRYDREKYVAVLDALEDAGSIVSYTDRCSKENGFRFDVTLKRDFFKSEDPEEKKQQIIKVFKLHEKVSQRIVVIGQNGRVRTYESASDLIRDFVEIRIGFTQKRIDKKIEETKEALIYALAKAKFIESVLNGSVVLNGRKKADVKADLEAVETFKPYVDRLVAMPIYSLTEEEIERLKEDAEKLRKDHEYWLTTDAKTEYDKDLKALKGIK